MSQAGNWYYIVVPSSALMPTPGQVKAWADYYGNIVSMRWNAALNAWNNQMNVLWLAPNTNYILYFVAENNNWLMNTSTMKLLFKTNWAYVPTTPTTVYQSLSVALNNISANSVSWIANVNVAWRWYYVVLPNGSAAPTSAQVKAWKDANGNLAQIAWNKYLYAWDNQLSITWLSTRTSYTLFFTSADANRNLLNSPLIMPFVTQ
jgi:hypothetical protein